MTKMTDKQIARQHYLLNTPREAMIPADKATQKMMYEAAIKAAKSAGNEKLAAAISAKYERLAPTEFKAPVDRKAVAAQAKETRAQNALNAFAGLLDVEVVSDEVAASEKKTRR